MVVAVHVARGQGRVLRRVFRVRVIKGLLAGNAHEDHKDDTEDHYGDYDSCYLG